MCHYLGGCEELRMEITDKKIDLQLGEAVNKKSSEQKPEGKFLYFSISSFAKYILIIKAFFIKGVGCECTQLINLLTVLLLV